MNPAGGGPRLPRRPACPAPSAPCPRAPGPERNPSVGHGNLVASAETSFEHESSPDGKLWEPLSPVIVKRRGSSRPIPRVEGDLRRFAGDMPTSRA